MDKEKLNALSQQVLDAAFRVHSVLGPGMLESAYVACMVHELRKAGLKVRTEVPVPVVYDGAKLADVGYRMDLLVEEEIIVEVKSVEALAPVHHAQLISYLKLADRRLELLLNFNAARLVDGGYLGRLISSEVVLAAAVSRRGRRGFAEIAEKSKNEVNPFSA